MIKIVLIFILLISNNLFAQTRFEFKYDQAGNRIQRKYFLFRMSNPEDSLNSTLISDSKFNIKVFPNPVSDFVSIEIRELSEQLSANIILVDGTGRRLLSKTQIKICEDIDTRNFKSGIYYLNIYLGSQKFLFKIIITE